MTALPDVNTLVALAWPNHVHHGAARAWFADARRSGWATCPVTQAGFVRVSSNRRVTPDARTPAEVVRLLTALVAVGEHTFWPDDVDWTRPDGPATTRLGGYRQVTDAHLVALAAGAGGQLVTFDRGAKALRPDAVTLLTLA